nr:unnamed protein product [Callosobruchus analis]
MSLVAKLTGGKRVNFTKRCSYAGRAHAATISHCRGPSWHINVLKKRTGHVGVFTNKILCRREKLLQNRRGKPHLKKTRKPCNTGGPDQHYGPNAAREDISSEELGSKCSNFLDKLANRVSSKEKVEAIESSTRGQHANNKWRELRRDYLTASNFGKVIKRRRGTPSHNLIKQLLYKTGDLQTPSITYGRVHKKNSQGDVRETNGCYCEGMRIIHIYRTSISGCITRWLGWQRREIKCLPSISGKFVRVDCQKENVCFSVQNGQVTLKKDTITIIKYKAN